MPLIALAFTGVIAISPGPASAEDEGGGAELEVPVMQILDTPAMRPVNATGPPQPGKNGYAFLDHSSFELTPDAIPWIGQVHEADPESFTDLLASMPGPWVSKTGLRLSEEGEYSPGYAASADDHAGGAGFQWPLLEIQDSPAKRPADSTRRPQPVEKGDAFLDFGRIELTPELGVLWFSPEYEADAEFCAGFLARVPMPWLSRTVLRLPDDRVAAFGSLSFSRIERESDPEPAHPSGTLLFLTLGLGYSVLERGRVRVTTQLGMQYADYGGVTKLDDGFALLMGASLNIQVAQNFRIMYSPEFVFANAGDKLFFNFVGLTISF